MLVYSEVFFTFLLLELSKRENSNLFKCDTHNEARVRGKVVIWPWRIRCGICTRNVQLRCDSDLKGRISYFDRRKLFIVINSKP